VKKDPFITIAMTIAMLSLAGIPPLAGFFAKYYIFTVAIESGYFGLVLLAVVTSLIGVYYYFRIIIAMYLKASDNSRPVQLTLMHQIVIIICVVITVLFGISPDLIISLI
jgi:NADH-quinone oxidoreductase subunit N